MRSFFSKLGEMALSSTVYKATQKSKQKEKKKQKYIPNEEHDNASGNNLNEMEISNLPDKEFKIMVIKCLLN